jgi:protein involved in polysaccharide export with SLBB domain
MVIASSAFGQEIRVSVNGEVARPGEYQLIKGDRLSSLIERAGGFAGNARMSGAVLSRESAREKKEPLLRELVSRIEREAFAKPGEEARKREFLRKLSELKPGNLIPVRIAHPRLLKGSEDDLLLEDGDAVIVPSKTEPVTVIGAVKSPGAVFPYTPETDPKEYIRKTGGSADDAAREHAYLLRTDGTAIPLSREWIRWNPGDSRWEIPAFREPAPQVEPGDTIMVPKKPARSSWAHSIDGLPRLLMEIHVLTGTRVDPP